MDEPAITKTGKVLTDEELNALADEAERGYEHHLYVGTFPDGSQLLVTQWLRADGTVGSTTAATRPRAHQSVVWGPPIQLREPE